MAEQAAQRRSGECGGFPLAVDPGPPQRLVGIDVADPRHHGLVEQATLDGAAARLEARNHPIEVEGRLEGIGCDVRDRLWYAVRPGVGQRHPAEGALVDEPQFRASVGEAQPGVQVLLRGREVGLDEQLPAHPEVHQQGVCRFVDLDWIPCGFARRARRAKVEPQVLPAPSSGQDTRPDETPDGRVKVTDFGLSKALGPVSSGTELGSLVGTPDYMSPEQCRGEPVDARSGQVAADHPWPGHRNGRDAAPDDMLGEAPTDGLDLG